jgi:post-segregation antitoxin (ccd killing protein)
LLERETTVPPAGAVVFRVTVHTALVPEARLVGLHVSEVTSAGTAKPIVAVCETPLSVAVSVAL